MLRPLTKTKFEDVAKDVDVVLDSVGKDTLARSYGVVKKGGFIVSLVAEPEQAELAKHGIRGAPLSVEPNSDELKTRWSRFISGLLTATKPKQLSPQRVLVGGSKTAAP